MVWSKLKGETKVAVGALVLSLLAFFVGEYRNFYSNYTEEFKASVKLEIIAELTEEPYAMKYDALKLEVLKLNLESERFWPWEKITEGEIAQAVYELTKDKLVLFAGSSNTYEFVSFSSAHNIDIESDEDQYHNSEAGIKLNIMSILRDNKALTQQQIYAQYEMRFERKTKKYRLAGALYTLIKDEIVLFTSNNGKYELKSYNSIHQDS